MMQPRLNCSPGALILYQEHHSGLPAWPSICLTNEATPASFLQTRPYGFRTIVLKLAPILNVGQLRWAKTSELLPFDPMNADEVTKRCIPGLQDAYAIANENILSESDLEYWKIMLASSLDEEVVVLDDNDDDDEQMRLAIEMGIIYTSSQVPKSSQFPPTRVKAQGENTRAKTAVMQPFDNRLSLSTRRSIERPSGLLTPLTSPPRKPHSFDYHLPIPKRRMSFSSDTLDDDAPVPSQKKRRSHIALDLWDDSPSQTPQKALLKSPYQVCSDSDKGEHDELLSECLGRSAEHTARDKSRTNATKESTEVKRQPITPAAGGDTVEGDIGESSQFVQVFVGSEVDPASDNQIDPERRRYKFQLIKQHVWNRPYFQDSLSARNYFTPIGENTWELAHPELVNISSDDFCFVAEYLSNGRFGYREPEDQEQFAEFFAQCMSAWRTAEQLKADDLLNHIVEKIHAVHDMRDLWDLWNPVVFSCSIYQADLALDAHTELKALFSEFVAEHYHAYLADDDTSGLLLTSFRQLPELEKDVLAKRIDLLERPI